MLRVRLFCVSVWFVSVVLLFLFLFCFVFVGFLSVFVPSLVLLCPVSESVLPVPPPLVEDYPSVYLSIYL